MAEEVRITVYDVDGHRDGEDEERVFEWEDGLPNVDDLTPLSQLLISSELLSAFNITPDPYRSMTDVTHASHNTLANLRGEMEQPSLTRFNSATSFTHCKGDAMDVEGEGTADLTPGGSDCRKLQQIGSAGDGDGDGGGAVEETETETESDLQANDPSSRVLKRPRLVWTPQLHKRFIEVVAHLGLKNAVPKTIMQLMNVEGLTRENVASHLQKYRLYLKRNRSSPQGAPLPHNLHDSGAGSGNGYHPSPAPIPMPYPPQMFHHMPFAVANSEFKSISYPFNTAVQGRNWSEYNFDSGYQHGMTSNKK